MAGKKRECKSCRKMMRSDNLKNHEKICTGGSPSDTFKKISAMIGMKEPPTSKTEEVVKNKGIEVNSPISITQLRPGTNASVNLKNGQKEERMDISPTESEVSDDSDDNDNSDDVDDDDEKINFYDLITQTAKTLTKNLRENLHKLLFDTDFGYFDEKIRKTIKDFLDGKENVETVTHFLRNDLHSMKETLPLLDPVTVTLPLLDPVTETLPLLDPVTETLPLLDPVTETTSLLDLVTETRPLLDPVTETLPLLDLVTDTSTAGSGERNFHCWIQ